MTLPDASESNENPSWSAEVQTPAFVFDGRAVTTSARRLRSIADRCGAQLLYSVKACGIPDVLQLVAPHVHGFSVSSVFEARLTRSVAPSHLIHCISPALRLSEAEWLLSKCNRVTVNSVGQLQRITGLLRGTTQLGLRVNPGTHFVRILAMIHVGEIPNWECH